MLFGLTAVQYAKHPEGMLEYSTRKNTARIDAWLAKRRTRASGDAGPPGEAGVAVLSGTPGPADDPVGADAGPPDPVEAPR